ncbi:MAG: acyl-CoA/acyl-ACP dehydrogenase [Marinobacter sp.]|uniref:acyl-CoA dehydrogenase family protein n=1 Tax=Marinobacter sp. 2_MG-2023 TaxID=3062679 RepID=UPI002656BD4B|nr:acyl-CoA dehydrogenase family protein [Marinobacter sp. 2_MG-2023]MDN6320739.1 acyl-CoA/acyl-ACP dehydrogenase [Marinobacter sp.]MDO6441735.1 acyl-CoA dehydrogenase family protein [Marinobacter sp. 2_MG-2023]
MNSVAVSSNQALWADDSQVLADVSMVGREQLAPAAYRIDHEGYYPLDIMANLGQAGAFAGHLDQYGARYGLAVASMQEISRHCGSTGFMTWCHDVCGLYMEQSGNPALLARLPDHTAGRTFGGTGLSNPMKAFTGIEKMALKARKVPGGYSVSGTLPWVSHIAPGQYCGVIASVDRDDGTRSHEIMFLLDLDERVTLRKCPEFSGMEGTSTWAIPLVDYFVSQDQIIADPARPFIQRVRAAFILLQAGMATGVIQGSIDSAREVEPSLGHVNQYLHDRPDELQAELDEMTEVTSRLCQTPFDGSKEFLLDVLDLRAWGSELALKASQSALLHQGARGYLMNSSPQRRIREAHFVAIVTPALKHLRWEMAKQMREEVPA